MSKRKKKTQLQELIERELGINQPKKYKKIIPNKEPKKERSLVGY